MLKNNLKIAWRKLKADKTFSIINILGLSIGLTITIVLFLFVMQERSFDQMYVHKERIYRVLFQNTEDNETWATVPAALKPATIGIPEIEKSSRLWDHNFGKTASIGADGEQFIEPKLYYADAEFFEIFQTEFIYGNSKTALARPNTVVLSQSTAEKYFGKGNPVGKSLGIDNHRELEITGVYRDFPRNSSFDGNIIASFNSTGFFRDPSWSNASFETYFLLNNNDPASVENKMQELIDLNVPLEDQWYGLSLQALEEIHLYSGNIESGLSSKTGSIEQVRNFSLLAFLILLIACINYMNLATAKSQKNTKDVAINKTLGASGKMLALRFFLETGFLTAIAIFFALLLSIAGAPLFQFLTANQLPLNYMTSFEFLGSLLLIWCFTTLIAGSFPAIYLSKFSPMEIERLAKKSEGFPGSLRKGLVILQFTASVILIISAFTIYDQMEFVRTKDLGYNPENTVAISIASVNSRTDKETLRSEFEKLPEVSGISMAQGFPGMSVSGRSLYKTMNSNEAINIQTNRSNGGIVEVLQLPLLAGEDLPEIKKPGDSIVDVVLNKKAVDFLGLTPEEAIGENLIVSLGPTAYVVGVVDDFNFSSLHAPIGAYAFHNNNYEALRYMVVRFSSQELTTTMGKFEETYKQIAPTSVFDYSFLDKNVEKLYAADQRTAQAALFFAALAIFLACLGLFGLAAFMTDQRTKEIGIRKVLGASVGGITFLLSKDLIKLVLISLLIAFPIAYWLTERWLQEFAYRVDIGWQIFIVAGILALVIAFVTVSFQAIKAAISNPINSLKNE